jgi:hypothetical protein
LIKPSLRSIKPSHRWTCACLVSLVALTLVVSGAPKKFYDDDPVWIERDHQDASGVRPWRIDLIVNVVFNLFGKLGDPSTNVRAKNLNTVDEVPFQLVHEPTGAPGDFDRGDREGPGPPWVPRRVRGP